MTPKLYYTTSQNPTVCQILHSGFFTRKIVWRNHPEFFEVVVDILGNYFSNLPQFVHLVAHLPRRFQFFQITDFFFSRWIPDFTSKVQSSDNFYSEYKIWKQEAVQAKKFLQKNFPVFSPNNVDVVNYASCNSDEELLEIDPFWKASEIGKLIGCVIEPVIFERISQLKTRGEKGANIAKEVDEGILPELQISVKIITNLTRHHWSYLTNNIGLGGGKEGDVLNSIYFGVVVLSSCVGHLSRSSAKNRIPTNKEISAYSSFF